MLDNIGTLSVKYIYTYEIYELTETTWDVKR